MPGPLPKNPATRARRSSRGRILSGSTVKAPKLPTDRTWHPLTLAWWTDVWSSPMATEYVQSDRHGLLLMALLMERFWEQPSPAIAAELRAWCREYGLTPLDRRRLEWLIEQTPPGQPETLATKRRDDPRLRLIGA